MSDFSAADPKLFFSKNDPLDPRLGDLVQNQVHDQAQDLVQAEVVILGYPDDEGVKLNGGRVGAAQGPDEIRNWLYRTTPHPKRKIKTFCDQGDLKSSDSLELRHQKVMSKVAEHLKKDQQLLTLGGGNDYAFADGLAFLEKYENKSPLVINVDAHLDVRDTKSSSGARNLTSGTPFYRLLESGRKFEFIEFGIQTQCNSSHHWNYVAKKGGKIISLEELLDSGRSWLETTQQFLGTSMLRQRPTFLAIDIDAFAWPYAEGSSAAWPIGLDPQSFWPVYQFFLKRLDVRVLGIYEVAPPLQNGAGTAKLAAQLAHAFLHHV